MGEVVLVELLVCVELMVGEGVLEFVNVLKGIICGMGVCYLGWFVLGWGRGVGVIDNGFVVEVERDIVGCWVLGCGCC